MNADIPLIFDHSRQGRRASSFPAPEVKMPAEAIPAQLRRAQPPVLPQVSERDLVAHYTRLSRMNYAIDVGAYPLGSCTMKYNPKINDRVAADAHFANLHPWQPQSHCQGTLELLHQMERYIAEITGTARVTFQPAAGAQGELTGLLVMKAFHKSNGDTNRRVVLIPDSAHGTNPASVVLAGYDVMQVPSDERGLVDLSALEKALNDGVAGLMLTNPNTLGLFEEDILAIADLVHGAGGLLYFDGANLNAILGRVRPGDMGFDIVHLNLHKTFSTPHGGGGPGSGPLCVSQRLERFLPAPVVERNEGGFYWDHDRPESIGRIHSFYGNTAVVIRAYAYIRALGAQGLKRVSEMAVLNANYLRALIADEFPPAFAGPSMHEVVVGAAKFRKAGIKAMDIAKRMIDFGFHPPTVYFPLIVAEALMIEPTETESRETVQALAQALAEIAREALDAPQLLREAPVTTPVRRLDEAAAARNLVLRWHGSAQ